MKVPEIQTYETTPSIAPVRTLENVQRGLRMMTEDHIKAEEQEGKLGAYRGQLMASVHESERANVAQRFDAYMENVRQNVNVSTGYKGYSLGDFSRAIQEVPNDYYFLGRVKSNADYEKFKENIMNSKISQAQKDYIINNNPYYYYDVFEGETNEEAKNRNQEEIETGIKTTGKVMGGSNWTPSVFAVDEKDTDEFMMKVAQSVGKTFGGPNSTIYYMDAAGNFTTDASKSVDNLWYYQKQDGGFEKLDSSKVYDAIQNAFSTDSSQDEWLRRQWEIGKWNRKRGNSSFIDDFTDSHGNVLDYNEYKDQIIKRFSDRVAYYKPGGTQYHEGSGMTALASAAKTAASKRNSSGSGNDINSKSILFNYDDPSGMIKLSVETAAGKIADKVTIEASMKNLCTEYNIPINGRESAQEIYDLISNYYYDRGKKVPSEIINQYKNWKKLNEELETEFENDPETKQAFEFKAALDHGVDLATLTDNDYAYGYLQQVKEVYTNPSGDQINDIYFAVTDPEKCLQNLPDSMKTNNGITSFVDNNGRTYIKLNKNSSQYLYQLNKYLDEIGQLTFGAGTWDKNTLSFKQGSAYGNYQGTYYKDNNGNIVPSRNSNWTNSFVNDIDDPYVKATKHLEKKHIALTPTEDKDIPLWTTTENNILSMYAMGMNAENSIITRAEGITEQAIQALTGADIPEIQVGTNKTNTRFRVDDPNKRADIMTTIQSILRSNEKSRVEFHTDKRGLGTLITVAANLNEKSNYNGWFVTNIGDENTGTVNLTADNQFSVYIPNWMSSDIKEQLEAEPGYREQQQLYKNYVAGHDTPIFDCTYRLSTVDGKNYVYHRKGEETGNVISEARAAKLYRLSELVDGYNTLINANNIDENSPEYRSILANVIVSFADAYGVEARDPEGKPNIDNWPVAVATEFNRVLFLLEKQIH